MSASQTTTSKGIPTSASELKERANALYRQGSFAEANDIYQSIIEQYGNNVSVQIIRTTMCNRAACFIKLGAYHSALEELDQIFWQRPDPIPIDEQCADPIFHKAHFRKAQCLLELGKGAEALQELDIYRAMVDGEVDDTEPHFREKILSLISKSSDKESTTSNMRPFVYAIHVFGRETPVILNCNAPRELFALDCSREAATTFVANLVKKHDEFAMNSNTRGWTCWNCSKPAVSLTHTPTMYLHLSSEKGGPKIIDFVQPVCKTRGPCDMEARRAMQLNVETAGLRLKRDHFY